MRASACFRRRGLARIRSVEIIDSYRLATAAQQKPLYQWASEDVLAGGTGQAGANPNNVFGCDDIIMPQRRFTVHASINLDHADAKGVIFSALAEHRWMQQAIEPTDPLGNTRGHDVPRAQGGEAGLQIYFSHGKLATNLNGTREPGSIGMTLDAQGRLTVAGHARRNVYRLESLDPNGPITVLADSYKRRSPTHH